MSGSGGSGDFASLAASLNAQRAQLTETLSAVLDKGVWGGVNLSPSPPQAAAAADATEAADPAAAAGGETPLAAAGCCRWLEGSFSSCASPYSPGLSNSNSFASPASPAPRAGAAAGRPKGRRPAPLKPVSAQDYAKGKADGLLNYTPVPTPDPSICPAAAGLPSVPRDGEYTIIRELGKGNFGTVYKAERNNDRRELVAVKKLSYEEIDPATVEKELAWVRNRDKRRHRNILRILDAFVVPIDRQIWIVMELMGCSLAYLIDKTQQLHHTRCVSEASVAGVGWQLFSALQHLHTQDEVTLHRDIKPDNILLKVSGVVKLGDFGAARSAGKLGIPFTTYAVGSEAYMSPERLKAEEYGPPSDVFSASLVMLEMVEGKLPVSTDDFFEKLSLMAELPRTYSRAGPLGDLIRSGLGAQGDRPSAGQALESAFFKGHFPQADQAQEQAQNLTSLWAKDIKDRKKRKATGA